MSPDNNMNILKSVLILLMIIFSGCGKSNKHAVDKYHDSLNEIERAGRFSLEKKNGVTEIKIIDPWQGADGVNQVYYLMKRGSE